MNFDWPHFKDYPETYRLRIRYIQGGWLGRGGGGEDER
jgi:hypothetical protein